MFQASILLRSHTRSSIVRHRATAALTLSRAGTPAVGSAEADGLVPWPVVSPDGGFLYVVDAGVAKVSAFAVDGTSVAELAGSPVAIPGGGAPFGIVVD